MYPKFMMMAGTALIGLALAGCSATAGGGTASPPDCGAAALQDKVGQTVTGQSAADVRVGGEPVPSRGNVRVVAPGQAVTMDFNADRLTIDVDAAGRLVRAQCT